MTQIIRSLLSVPGNRTGMLEKARDLPADALHLDLEDAVPPGEKETARQILAKLLPGYARRGQLVTVRVNPLDTGLTAGDLDAVMSPDLYGISLPKPESPEDVLAVDRMITEREALAGLRPGQIRLLVWIETPRAVLRAYEIASASQRIAAIILGADDFTREMAIQRTKQGAELDFARWMVALAARASGVLGLDTGYPDFRDEEGLISEAAHARQMGFDGKFLIHPSQIGPVNQIFRPSEEEVQQAGRVSEAFAEAVSRGEATTSLDDSLIDTAIARRAQQVLEKARLAAEREKPVP